MDISQIHKSMYDTLSEKQVNSFLVVLRVDWMLKVQNVIADKAFVLNLNKGISK